MDCDIVNKMRQGVFFLWQKIAVLNAEKRELVQPESILLPALSPLDFLPDELLGQILVYASRYFIEDTTQRLGGDAEVAPVKLLRQFPLMLLTVCRRWYQIASSTPMFWAMQRRRAHLSWGLIPELVWKPFFERAGPSIPLAADLEVSWPLGFSMDHPEDEKSLWPGAGRWKYLTIREFGFSIAGSAAVAGLIALQQSNGIDWDRAQVSFLTHILILQHWITQSFVTSPTSNSAVHLSHFTGPHN